MRIHDRIVKRIIKMKALRRRGQWEYRSMAEQETKGLEKCVVCDTGTGKARACRN